MCNKSLLFCLIVVVGGILAKSEDDLNLKSIFRTPKDFSKVNFDHFELLERNNFDDKNSAQSTSDNDKVKETKAEDKTPKSAANAQVMLRIGGEDIHDCNRVYLNRPYSSDHPVYSEHVPLHSNDIHYSSLPHHGAYPCLPQPPFNIPGGYYTPGHLSPGYSTSYQSIKTNTVPHEITINLPEAHSTQGRHVVEEHFIEAPKKEVVCTENVSTKVVVEKPCDKHVEEVVVANVQPEPCKNVDQQEQHTLEVAKPAVVETSCTIEDTPKVSNQECADVNTIHATTIESEPTPTKVAYAEVNLADIGKPCFDSPKDDIATLLDQALVPLSCQKCSRTTPLLVSYPVITHEGNVATIPQEEVVSQCSSCSHDAFCESCNRERNPETPYGHRFAKDVDSLFEIADNSPELYVPPSLYNDAPSENLIKVQPAQPPVKLTISTVVPTEDECQHEKEEVQISAPTCETAETPCQKQEVAEESSPCSETVTTVESTAHTKLVPVELPQVVEQPAKHQVSWSNKKPCHQTVTESNQVYSETVESPYVTQEVQVSNGCHESFGIQHGFNDFVHGAPEESNYQPAVQEHGPHGDIVHILNQYSNSPYAHQTVEVSNPCHESPYTIQEGYQVGTSHQEPAQAVFQGVSSPTRFTKPGSLTEVTFYPDDGSRPTTKFVREGNSYNGVPCPIQNVDHSITIQPVYKRFPTATAEVSTYHDFLTKLYPGRSVVQTPIQYTETPYVEESVPVANQYHQASYVAQRVSPTDYPGSESMRIQPVSAVQGRNSYEIQTPIQYTETPYVEESVPVAKYQQASYVAQRFVPTVYPGSESMRIQPVPAVQESYSYNMPYSAQEAVQATNPSSESFTVQSIYNKIPASQVECSYNQVPYTSQSSIQVSKSYQQVPYTTQEVIQQRLPSHNSIPVKHVCKKCPDIDVRSSCDQTACRTRVIQRRNACPESSALHSVQSKVLPFIRVRNSYNQVACTSQQAYQASQPRAEAYSSANAYNAQPVAVSQSYNLPASGAQPCETHQQTSVTAPTAYSNAGSSYYQTSYGTQPSTSCSQSTTTAPSAYSNLGSTYYQTSYGSQPSTSCSQSATTASSAYSNAVTPYYHASYGTQQQQSTPCSQSTSSAPSTSSNADNYYYATYGTQQSTPCPQATTATSSTAFSNVVSPYYQTSYGTQQSAPCSQPISTQSLYKAPDASHYQAEHLKPSAYASYTAYPYSVHSGAQSSCPHHQATSPSYTIPEVSVEKPQVYYSAANTNSHAQYSVDYSKYGNEQPKICLDGYKATYGSGVYSDPLKSILYKQPTIVDNFKYGTYVPHKAPAQPSQYWSPAYYSSPVQHTQSAHPLLSLYGNYKASNPITPVYHYPAFTSCVPQQPKVSQPHIYKIVLRYDNVPKDEIKALNIPDLVPTDQYLKVDRPACQHVPVDSVPLVKSEPYAYGQGYSHGWPYWKNVPVQRETPVAPSYYPVCSQCAKYRGELNQVSCDR